MCVGSQKLFLWNATQVFPYVDSVSSSSVLALAFLKPEQWLKKVQLRLQCRGPTFCSYIYRWPRYLWPSHLTSLCLSFLICKMGIRKTRLSRAVVRITRDGTCEVLRTPWDMANTFSLSYFINYGPRTHHSPHCLTPPVRAFLSPWWDGEHFWLEAGGLALDP